MPIGGSWHNVEHKHRVENNDSSRTSTRGNEMETSAVLFIAGGPGVPKPAASVRPNLRISQSAARGGYVLPIKDGGYPPNVYIQATLLVYRPVLTSVKMMDGNSRFRRLRIRSDHGRRIRMSMIFIRSLTADPSPSVPCFGLCIYRLIFQVPALGHSHDEDLVHYLPRRLTLQLLLKIKLGKGLSARGCVPSVSSSEKGTRNGPAHNNPDVGVH
jgi:hypothetical protein